MYTYMALWIHMGQPSCAVEAFIEYRHIRLDEMLSVQWQVYMIVCMLWAAPLWARQTTTLSAMLSRLLICMLARGQAVQNCAMLGQGWQLHPSDMGCQEGKDLFAHH